MVDSVLPMNVRHNFNILKQGDNCVLLEKMKTNDPSFSHIKLRFSHLCPVTELKQVTECLKSNTTIKSLCLRHNDFNNQNDKKSGERARVIASLLENNHTIQELDLSLCDMDTNDLSCIIIALQYNKSVSKLHLSIFNAEKSKVLSDFLTPCPKHALLLEILNPLLGPEGAHKKSQELLPINMTLTKLHLDIQCGVLKNIADSLCNNTSIEELHLDICICSGSEFLYVSHILQNNSTLKNLHLSWNSWFDKHPDHVHMLGQGLNKNSSVQILHMKKVTLTGKDACAIVNALENNTNLVELSFCISNDMKELMQALAKNMTLEKVELLCAEFDMKCLSVLMDWIIHRKKSVHVKIVYNEDDSDNEALVKKIRAKVEENGCTECVDVRCSNDFLDSLGIFFQSTDK